VARNTTTSYTRRVLLTRDIEVTPQAVKGGQQVLCVAVVGCSQQLVGAPGVLAAGLQIGRGGRKMVMQLAEQLRDLDWFWKQAPDVIPCPHMDALQRTQHDMCEVEISQEDTP
jgi:hypothetical protein